MESLGTSATATVLRRLKLLPFDSAPVAKASKEQTAAIGLPLTALGKPNGSKLWCALNSQDSHAHQ